MTTVLSAKLTSWLPWMLAAMIVAVPTVVAPTAQGIDESAFRIAGWSSAAIKVTIGDESTVRIRLMPAPHARIRVTLQTRPRGSTTWSPAGSSKTTRRGVSRVRIPSVRTFRGSARLVVATPGGRTASAVRGLVVTALPTETDEPEPPTEPIASPEFEAEVLRLVNTARSQSRWCGPTEMLATGPLEWQDRLGSAARAYALRMGTEGFYAHYDPTGQGPADRATAAGYTGFFTGENIAGGADTPAEVVQGWLYSPGHCQNMMQPSYLEIGVGYMLVPGSPWSTYWVQMFGA